MKPVTLESKMNTKRQKLLDACSILSCQYKGEDTWLALDWAASQINKKLTACKEESRRYRAAIKPSIKERLAIWQASKEAYRIIVNDGHSIY